MGGSRLKFPATQRNRDPILARLKEVLPKSGTVLEIASGSGEHVVHFARALPELTFQPSDIRPEHLESIAAWIGSSGVPNILPPIFLDVTAETWPIERADAVISINMIHIAPWAATEGLLRGAARVLNSGAVLYLYGPYKRGGRHTADSNQAFDAQLRAQNPEWGVRDLDDVAALAGEMGFGAPAITDMPANNLSVVLRRL
jgi:SAM-dependent methyltransferase